MVCHHFLVHSDNGNGKSFVEEFLLDEYSFLNDTVDLGDWERFQLFVVFTCKSTVQTFISGNVFIGLTEATEIIRFRPQIKDSTERPAKKDSFDCHESQKASSKTLVRCEPFCRPTHFLLDTRKCVGRQNGSHRTRVLLLAFWLSWQSKESFLAGLSVLSFICGRNRIISVASVRPMNTLPEMKVCTVDLHVNTTNNWNLSQSPRSTVSLRKLYSSRRNSSTKLLPFPLSE